MLRILCKHANVRLPTNAILKEARRTLFSCTNADLLFKEVEIEVRGHDPAVLKSYEFFACEAAKHLDIKLEKTWVPRRHILRRSVLKSIHVHKKHFVQYEERTHFRVMLFKYLTGSTAETYLEYIQRNLPEGVAMKVTKHALERLPEHIQPPVTTEESNQQEQK